MLERFAPQMAQALLAGGEGNHGDGLLMAMKLGAGAAWTCPTSRAPTASSTSRTPARTAPASSPSTRARSRSTAPAAGSSTSRIPYKALGDASLAQPTRTHLAGLRRQGHGRLATTRCRSTTSPAASAPACSSRADTVEELAARLGTDPGVAGGDGRRLQRAGSPRASPTRSAACTSSGGVGERLPARPRRPSTRSCPGTVVLATYCGVTVDTVDARPRRLRRARSSGSTPRASSSAGSTAPAT